MGPTDVSTFSKDDFRTIFFQNWSTSIKLWGFAKFVISLELNDRSRVVLAISLSLTVSNMFPNREFCNKAGLKSEISGYSGKSEDCVKIFIFLFKICFEYKDTHGGLLYLGSLRFLQFFNAVFQFLTNIGAFFRFCRLLRFAEIDVFLTRFSALSYYYCGFSVFEKDAIFVHSPTYRGSRFANIILHITACSFRYVKKNTVQ